MRQLIADAGAFFRREVAPDMGEIGLEIFLVLVAVLILGAVNIVARIFVDPLAYKVLRIPHTSRWPAVITLLVTFAVGAYLLAWGYRELPLLRPTVLGWAGRHFALVLP